MMGQAQAMSPYILSSVFKKIPQVINYSIRYQLVLQGGFQLHCRIDGPGPEQTYRAFPPDARKRFEGGDRPLRWEPFFEYGGPGDRAGEWPHRPVEPAIGVRGELLVTSDASGVVIAIGWGETGK